jgi:hypothetical protein
MRRAATITGLGLAVLALVGCAAPAAMDTPSGKAEVTIEGVSPEQVKPLLVNEMLNRKYTISHDSPYLLGFDKPTDSILVSALVGTGYDSTPNVRVSYTLAQIGHETRVIADLAVIGNPGSAFEQRHDLNGGVDTPKYQAVLDRIKTELEAKAPGVMPPPSSQVE